MSDAKLQVKIGGVEFSGEGSEKWLSEQLKVILDAAPKLSDTDDESNEPLAGDKPHAKKAKGEPAVGTLAAYLTDKKTSSNQVLRFLATADWMRLSGTTVLTTAAVVKALKDKHQAKLSNPSQCLNSNVTKGLAEKTSDGFFITPAGIASLGSE